MKKLLFLLFFLPLVSFGQNLPSDWTEKSVRNFFNKKGFKGIEGIYSFSQDKYSFGSKKSDKYAIIYSKNDFAYIGYSIKPEQNQTYRSTKHPSTKLILQESATNGIFNVEWYPDEICSPPCSYYYPRDDGYHYGISVVHPSQLNDYLEKYPKAKKIKDLWNKAHRNLDKSQLPLRPRRPIISFWANKANGALLSNLDYDNVFLMKMFPTAKKNRAPKKTKKTKKKDWAGNGSGLIISKQGYIVTNYHVIKDIDSIEVEFKNDLGINKFKAKVINSDESNDLAIIQIIDKKFEGFEETPNYNFDTEIAEVGTKVYAYGYPMALSVMGKEIKITDGIINSKMGYKDDIKTYQVSAPIQGGNSGGPLFDENGTLVGINSSGLSKEIADNVGYSIKSNYISNLISALPQKIELPYSYTIKWISTEKQIKRLSKYVVLIKVK